MRGHELQDNINVELINVGERSVDVAIGACGTHFPSTAALRVQDLVVRIPPMTTLVAKDPTNEAKYNIDNPKSPV